MTDPEIEADLIRFIGERSIIALVLTEEQLEAAHRLIERGALRKTWPSGAHTFLGVYHLELVR